MRKIKPVLHQYKLLPPLPVYIKKHNALLPVYQM